MSRLVLLVTVMSVATFAPRSATAQGKPAKPSEESAKAFVQKFLDWYVPLQASLKPDQRRILVALEEKGTSFDPELADALRRDEEATMASEGFIVGLDSDPFLFSQDFCDRYLATRAVRKGASYRVDVRGTGGCEDHDATDSIAEVTWRDGRWVFVNFHDPRKGAPDLRSRLKRLADDRARSPPPEDWHSLVESGAYRKARELCERRLDAASDQERVDARVCLANVEAGEGEITRVEATKKYGGCIFGSYLPEAARRAVKYLDEAIRIAPQDLSLHKGKLHMLERAGLVDELGQALRDSAATYKGADPLSTWLAYPRAFWECRAYPQAASLWLVLDSVYPDDHRLAGNLAAAYAMMEQDDAALAWAKKAVARAPDDPTDTWNLARVLDYRNEVGPADAAYQRAVSLQPADRREQTTCLYVKFLTEKAKDPKRACAVAKGLSCEKTVCEGK